MWSKVEFSRPMIIYIPDSPREQLYAEENQRDDKRKKTLDNSTIGSMCPLVNINVLPAGSSSQLIPTPANDTTTAHPSCAETTMVHGLFDVAVEEYTEWQQSRVRNEAFRDNIEKACNVTLENCLDLMQVYEDQDPGFFVKHGVKVGAPRPVLPVTPRIKRAGTIILKGRKMSVRADI